MGEVDTTVSEAGTTRSVWLAALTIIGRYPLAVLAPAAVLGALGEIPAYLIEGRPLLDRAITLVTAYIAYYLTWHTLRGSSGRPS